jgi:hypothetical protein
MKRLDQGHLHSKLDISRTRASAVGGEHSRKKPFTQLVNSYSEHLHMSVQPVENAHDNPLFLIQTFSRINQEPIQSLFW